MSVRLQVHIEHWPIAGSFTISRGVRTEAVVVVAELRDGPLIGRGEGVPLARYDQSPESTLVALQGLAQSVAGGLDRRSLRRTLPPGPARNALDCALWDLEAKGAGLPVWELAGVAAPQPLVTAFTISLESPDDMAAQARAGLILSLIGVLYLGVLPTRVIDFAQASISTIF